MALMEQKNNMDQIFLLLQSAFKEKFPPGRPELFPMAYGSEGWLQNSKGVPFSLHKMGDEAPWNFFVIEYGDTGEDGDSFYPDDYDSIEDMISEMIEEIEG